MMPPRRSGFRRLGQQIRSFWRGPLALRDPATARYFGAGPAASGVPVDEYIALTYSAVWDAVQQIAGDVAKLPLVLYKFGEGGIKQPYRDAKLFRLLHDRPNPETSSLVFRRTLTAHALTWGNGYAEIERDNLGRPAALHVLTPDRVQVQRDALAAGRWGSVRYVIDSGKTTLDPEDVIHLQGLSYDGLIGYNLIHHARQSIGLALAMERFGATFFANGSTFGGVLSTDEDLDETQQKDIQTAIEALHRSVDKAHRFLVLPGGFKYDRLAINPSESQMKEARAAQIEEVARYFNMPVHKLKNLDRATNNNIEQQDLEYYKGPILTWTKTWEEELNAKLIRPLEYGRQFIKHNVSGFLRGDIKSRYDAFGIARDKGVINADEWRDLEDWNPQPNGQGQLYLVQAAQIPVDTLAALADAQLAKAQRDAAPPAPSATDADVEAANDRADAADQARAAAEAALVTTRERIASLEASGTATDAELAHAREDLAHEQRVVGDLTVLSENLRVDANARRLAHEVAIQEAAIRQAETDAATARAAGLERELVDARAARETAHAMWTQAQAEAARETDRKLAAQAAAEAARADAQALQAAIATAEGARAEATIREALAVRQAADAAAETEVVRGTLVETQATLAARDATLAQQDRETGDLRTAQAAGLIAAHRHLYADVMRRMLAREIDRVHTAKTTPEKLTRWLETFYDGHEALMATALQPALAVHLATLGSTEDPAAVARTLAHDHATESARQLRLVLEGDADELAPALAPLLAQWEQRAAQFADRLMEQEITHAARAPR